MRVINGACYVLNFETRLAVLPEVRANYGKGNTPEITVRTLLEPSPWSKPSSASETEEDDHQFQIKDYTAISGVLPLP